MQLRKRKQKLLLSKFIQTGNVYEYKLTFQACMFE